MCMYCLFLEMGRNDLVRDARAGTHMHACTHAHTHCKKQSSKNNLIFQYTEKV